MSKYIVYNYEYQRLIGSKKDYIINAHTTYIVHVQYNIIVLYKYTIV